MEIARRVSAKVLVAFNHAYTTGEVEVARKLRSVRKVTEVKQPGGDKRTRYDAVVNVDLWDGFVDAYNT